MHVAIYEITTWVFTCIFDQDPNLDFLKAFEDYFHDRAEFSSKSMGLDMMKQLYLYDDQVHSSS